MSNRTATEAIVETGNSEDPLGTRLRARRRELKLTLKDVAEGAGLSVGFISQVERGLTVPSLSSLASIAAVLESHVTSFLAQPEGKSPHTRHNERPIYAVDKEALSYERLSTSFPGSVLNSVIVHEPPGYRSEPIQHVGEEMFFVLQGAITLEVDNETTVLEAGDSIHFASMRRHSSWNHTAEPATILHVCTMDVFGDNPQQNQEPGNRAGHLNHHK
ncbi:cupin domain-containing protein [Hoeflea sp.]|uniref:helix-turn-helix domain-containing protein n=1 Tax=Hoeflea sp. TaxID=1940281 RepID=UPI0025B83903|nr:cupin domain-containing protein [Hoeflea sp.]